jgi:hypothetical protein
MSKCQEATSCAINHLITKLLTLHANPEDY